MTRLGTIHSVRDGMVYLNPFPAEVEPGTAVMARGPSGDRDGIAYVCRVAGCVAVLSMDIGYGHGGRPGTPAAWTRGDVLEAR